MHPKDNLLDAGIFYNEYGGYCVPRSSAHRPAVQKVVHGQIWEPDTIEFMVSHCGTGDIVHAGTFFGDFLPALSKGCAPDAKIWAFEPVVENYRCADITIRINELNNVILQNVGLGAQSDEVVMQIANSSGVRLGGASRIAIGPVELEKHMIEKVRTVAIDDVILDERTISILQLDVEGYEQPALSGALKTIKRCHPVIILENVPKGDWFSRNILDLGYKEEGKLHDNFVFVPGS